MALIDNIHKVHPKEYNKTEKKAEGNANITFSLYL